MNIKAQILIRRKIPASDIQQAMRKIKTKYPYARMITYNFDKDFRFDYKRNYKNRTMTVAFVDNFMKIREEM